MRGVRPPFCVRCHRQATPMLTEILDRDRPWSADKIRMLIDGELLIEDEVYEGMTAFEMRCRAYDGDENWDELILEPLQLDRSIRRGIQRDHEVRNAMLLATLMGMDEWEVERMLRSRRAGYSLLARGIELVRRNERGEHRKLRRERAKSGRTSQPVCWKCVRTVVETAGETCPRCLNPRDRTPRTGPKAPYDPSRGPDPVKMTPEQREAEIKRLVDMGDERNPAWIPGGKSYHNRVISYGVEPPPRPRR